jgi:biopolymer transport protein ExbD
MRYSLLLIVIFCSCQSSPSTEVKKINNPASHTPRKNLLVTATPEDKIYIYNREVQKPELDSVLQKEINNLMGQSRDTVTVVINADTATSYGLVFTIMKSAKRAGAKVVANVR